MVNLIQSAKEQIKASMLTAFLKATTKGVLAGELPNDIHVERPKDNTHGDFASNFCMQAAKALKLPPKKIAQAILDELDFTDTYIVKAEIAGPGFLNFFLSHSYYEDALVAITSEGQAYGRTNFGENKKVMVEFVSANPTGPMHIGNARGGAIGDTLAAVLDWAGFDVTKEFYVNDAGNQIEKFFKSLRIRYMQLLLGDDAIALPEDCYQGEDIKERAKEFIALYGDKFLAVANPDIEDETALCLDFKEKMIEYALEKNVKSLEIDLAKYGIYYDVWFRESSLYKDNEVEKAIELLSQNGYTYEKEGAIWLKSSDFGCEKDEVLIRANGLSTYFAADIAYHRNKFVTRGFDICINVWGADHHGHVARMQGAMNALGLPGENLKVVLMQLVRLVRGGEAVRVSKRSGKSISLSDLLEETSVDAARFIFNIQRPDSHLEFDLDLAIEQSSQNPVFYVQYAHARICSILRKLKEEGVSLPQTDKTDLSVLSAKEEVELISHLASLPEEIRLSALEYEPSKITRYVIDLASLFHKFYNACHVNVEDETVKNARIVLISATATVIKNCLTILKVTAPEKM